MSPRAARTLELIRAAGPAGIKTDALEAAASCSTRTLAHFLRVLRGEGKEVYTLRGGAKYKATIYARLDWYEAGEEARKKAEKAARAARSARWEKKNVRRRANPVIVKPKIKRAARPVKPAPQPFWRAECTGPIPAPKVLPSAPVYAKHQLVELPPGWQSPLSARECRPWAAMVGQP